MVDKQRGAKQIRQSSREREREDRAVARQVEIELLEHALRSLAPGKRVRKRVLIGSRAFSARDILNEIRAETAYGEMFRTVVREIHMTKLRAAKR